MKENIIIEQYKQAHSDRTRSAQHQWQLISIGNAVLGGLLVSSITSNNPDTSLYLAIIALPLCFLILVAYRKYVYFENLMSDTIEAIEQSYKDILHVQYDTVPQKDHDLYYIVRYPKPGRLEQISMHTIMNFLFMIYNFLSLGLVAYFAYGRIPNELLAPIIIFILPSFYLIARILNVVDRGKRSFNTVK